VARSGEIDGLQPTDEGNTPAPTFARLISHSQLSFDAKNRLVLPAIHRPRYKAGVVCAPHRDHLAIHEPAEWDLLKSDLNDACRDGRIDIEVFDWLTARSVEALPDNAGRILIPRSLRAEVGLLDDDVIVAGHGKYLGVHRGDYISAADPGLRDAATAALRSLGL